MAISEQKVIKMARQMGIKRRMRQSEQRYTNKLHMMAALLLNYSEGATITLQDYGRIQPQIQELYRVFSSGATDLRPAASLISKAEQHFTRARRNAGRDERAARTELRNAAIMLSRALRVVKG